MNQNKRKLVFILAMLVASSMTLAGCSNVNSKDAHPLPSPTQIETVQPTITPLEQSSAEPSIPVAATDGDTIETVDSETLNDTQLNSINMLNYLVMLTQEINAATNSRLYLEEAYSSLINNTLPEAVDNRTLVEINYLLDTLEDYRMIAVKRERIQYIYEQNQAQALRNALPNPLGLMSAVHSFSLSGLIASVSYMALDSINSYLTSSAQADMQYLQDGWDLDDKQAAVLHGIRKGTFNYMVETVREYQLPGKLALTEQAVSDFVIWKNKSNNLQVIQFFEENRETYQAFGPYWLTLADCYFRNGDYAKCLEAIAQYELLNTQIFRRDYEYARILPLAIIAAHEEQDTISYIETATRYSETILRNTTNNEWPLRYFAAQTFIELFSLTNNHDYLLRAYDIALSNVNYMVEEQKSLNSTYLENVKTITADKTATKSQQEEIKQYNKLLTGKRKTELPPIYEPLLLNCELLFSLAEELGMPETELQRIDGILHENGEPIFLIEPINAQYSMKSDPDIDSLKECIVDMGLVNVGTNDKGVFALGEALGKLHAQPVRFLRRDLPRAERLADMVGDHIICAPNPSGGGDILALCQHKLGVGYTAITLIAGDKPAVVGLLRIGHIVDNLANGTTLGPALADMQRHDACGCHEVSLPSKNGQPQLPISSRYEIICFFFCLTHRSVVAAPPQSWRTYATTTSADSTIQRFL